MEKQSHFLIWRAENIIITQNITLVKFTEIIYCITFLSDSFIIGGNLSSLL